MQLFDQFVTFCHTSHWIRQQQDCYCHKKLLDTLPDQPLSTQPLSRYLQGLCLHDVQGIISQGWDQIVTIHVGICKGCACMMFRASSAKDGTKIVTIHVGICKGCACMMFRASSAKDGTRQLPFMQVSARAVPA